jgi:hypothetical protein
MQDIVGLFLENKFCHRKAPQRENNLPVDSVNA